MGQQIPENIIFFDGVCNLCNSFVDFLIKRDHARRFKFASLQGETARQLLPPHLLEHLESVIYWRRSKIYLRSAAAIHILADLGGTWSLLQIFLVLPAPLRDLLYRLIARYRYVWFGRRETCRLPSADEKAQFLP